MTRKWKDVTGSLAFGSVSATYQACMKEKESDLHGNDLDLVGPLSFSAVTGDGVQSTVEVTKDAPVAVWSRKNSDGSLITFTAAPVLVCKKPVNTVGLGDAISSSALSREL